MNRITRHQMFLEICGCAAKRSTCYRANVGALIVSPEHNIISMGYNGPPSGEPHCTGLSCEKTSSGGCLRAVHAEENAIRRASDIPRRSTLYTTYSPCADCTRLIFNTLSIERVFFQILYRESAHLGILNKQGRSLGQVTPNGIVVDPFTKEILEGELWD